MILLNERTQVKHAIKKWLEMYGLDRTYGADKRGRKVGAELLALDQETATADDVAEIIGNRSWVHEASCSECGATSWGIVQIGEPPDYESETAYLCRNCLQSALRLLGDA
jgi:hypothetical protein